jgi:hypothetical protein
MPHTKNYYGYVDFQDYRQHSYAGPFLRVKEFSVQVTYFSIFKSRGHGSASMPSLASVLQVGQIPCLGAKQPYGIYLVMEHARSKVLVSVNHTTCHDTGQDEIYYTCIVVTIFFNCILLHMRLQEPDKSYSVKSNSLKLLLVSEKLMEYIFSSVL